MTRAVAERDDSLGEAILALSEKEQQFVIEYVRHGTSMAEAVKLAGYGNEEGTSSSQSFARIAYRVSHREHVIAAIAEEVRKTIRVEAPRAVKAVREILDSPFHPQRAKVALNLIDRISPVVQHQQINVDVKVDHRQDSLDELRALLALNVPREKLEELFGFTGLPILMKQLEQKPIDAEFVEVLADPDSDLGL